VKLSVPWSAIVAQRMPMVIGSDIKCVLLITVDTKDTSEYWYIMSSSVSCSSLVAQRVQWSLVVTSSIGMYQSINLDWNQVLIWRIFSEDADSIPIFIFESVLRTFAPNLPRGRLWVCACFTEIVSQKVSVCTYVAIYLSTYLCLPVQTDPRE